MIEISRAILKVAFFSSWLALLFIAPGHAAGSEDCLQALKGLKPKVYYGIPAESDIQEIAQDGQITRSKKIFVGGDVYQTSKDGRWYRTANNFAANGSDGETDFLAYALNNKRVECSYVRTPEFSDRRTKSAQVRFLNDKGEVGLTALVTVDSETNETISSKLSWSFAENSAASPKSVSWETKWTYGDVEIPRVGESSQ